MYSFSIKPRNNESIKNYCLLYLNFQSCESCHWTLNKASVLTNDDIRSNLKSWGKYGTIYNWAFAFDFTFEFADSTNTFVQMLVIVIKEFLCSYRNCKHLPSIGESICCRYFDMVLTNTGNWECILKYTEYIYILLIQLDLGWKFLFMSYTYIFFSILSTSRCRQNWYNIELTSYAS